MKNHIRAARKIREKSRVIYKCIETKKKMDYSYGNMFYAKKFHSNVTYLFCIDIQRRQFHLRSFYRQFSHPIANISQSLFSEHFVMDLLFIFRMTFSILCLRECTAMKIANSHAHTYPYLFFFFFSFLK